jgi:selenocysteine-specific elongation factor
LHGEQPAQPGMEMESLRSKLCLDVPPKIFRTLIAELERDSVVVREQSVLRLPSHRTGLGESERRAADQLVARLEESGFTPPDGKALATELRLDEKRYHDLLARLEREGRVARVSPDLCYAAATVEKVRGLVREHVAAHGQIDAAALRDLIGASRKFSIALLTYFDRTGFTMRVGDVRKLRAKG